MDKKTSGKLDVGSEDFEEILQFLNEEEVPSMGTAEKKEWTALKTLLLAPAQNRRALRGYFQQITSQPKGDKVKKAA